MRILLGFFVIACVVGFFLHQRAQDAATPAPSPVAATPHKVSEHDWAKNSLDRVGELKKQVAAQRKANEVP
ncbi:MAG: hypothetical protein ACR2NX_08725 [Chthoniobacterales bacterium]